MVILWIALGTLSVLVAVNLSWRWLSRVRLLPCPSLLAWTLESPFFQKLNGTSTVLQRLDARPGQKVLEIGPGPGRLLIPVAQRVLPDGEAVGIDIQPGMIERLKTRADKAGVKNLTALLGDATQPHVPEQSFDLVFLCTVLGEIPDRAVALLQCHRALKPGGLLSITEVAGDPHYQRFSTVRRLAENAGFQFLTRQGRWWFYTATLKKI